jgi:hypothetical protein
VFLDLKVLIYNRRIFLAKKLKMQIFQIDNFKQAGKQKRTEDVGCFLEIKAKYTSILSKVSLLQQVFLAENLF